MAAIDRVAVWRIADCSVFDLESRLTVLSDDERARAARFVSESARQTFVCARIALRCILARRLGAAPDAFRFDYERWGKPRLSGIEKLHFSVTHSGSAAAIAVGTTPLGLDLERIVAISPDVVADSLTPEELARVGASSDSVASFYAHWTLKEAYLKALGQGLSVPLKSVSVRPGEPARVGRYCLKNLHLLDGCIAALAVDVSRGLLFPELDVADWQPSAALLPRAH